MIEELVELNDEIYEIEISNDIKSGLYTVYHSDG